MMFNSVKGYPHSRILVGMHASRERAALLLGCEPSELAKHVGQAVKKPVAPVVVPASQAPCQEQVFYADDPDFDLRKLLPAPQTRRLMRARSSVWGWCWQAIRKTAR
jgi:4-hydroxy-3-polyprenylbenzoate decarboxylase